MTQDKKARLEELKRELKDLKERNPAHCSGTGTSVGRQMSPQLFQKIEDLEEEIKALDAEVEG